MIESTQQKKKDTSIIDLVKLTFARFTTSDEGVYVCVRASGGSGNERTITIKRARECEI